MHEMKKHVFLIVYQNNELLSMVTGENNLATDIVDINISDPVLVTRENNLASY